MKDASKKDNLVTYHTGEEKKSMEIKQRTVVERKIDKSEHLLLSKQKK